MTRKFNMKKQNLALFDLDNTLLAGDSDYSWSLFLINEGLLALKPITSVMSSFI